MTVLTFAYVLFWGPTFFLKKMPGPTAPETPNRIVNLNGLVKARSCGWKRV